MFLEFLKEYWPLLVCAVLIIIAIILLIVFRDKKDNPEVENAVANNNTNEKHEEHTEEVKVEPTKEEIKEESKPQQEAVEEIIKEETAEDTKEETVEEVKETKPKTQKYMVTYDKDNKEWVVKKTGASRASKRCKTKKEAMEVAERLAASQELNLTVKKKDGKFQKR